MFLLIAMLGTLIAAGQSAEGRYASRMTTDGTIYFVVPKKIKHLSNLKKFEYDMTLLSCLSWKDSVTVNFTFESPLMEVPEKLEIKSGNNYFKCNDYHPLFIDIKKNHYEVRITSKFPLEEIRKMIESSVSPVFIFEQCGQPRSASYSPGAWRKDRKKLFDVMQIYLYSRK